MAPVASRRFAVINVRPPQGTTLGVAVTNSGLFEKVVPVLQEI